MIGKDWTHWFEIKPQHGVLIQWKRDDWAKPVTGYRADLDPHTNVVGLFWRLTGIGKTQI